MTQINEKEYLVTKALFMLEKVTVNSELATMCYIP